VAQLTPSGDVCSEYAAAHAASHKMDTLQRVRTEPKSNASHCGSASACTDSQRVASLPSTTNGAVFWLEDAVAVAPVAKSIAVSHCWQRAHRLQRIHPHEAAFCTLLVSEHHDSQEGC
jgi:hypothetical protein